MAVAGCRLDVETRLEVHDTGAGTLAVTFELDRELLDTLTATGFDPVPDAVPGWEVVEQASDDGLVVTVSSTFDDPAQLDDRVAALQAGLDDEDPRLLESVDLAVAEDGSADLAARVGVALPSSTGARGPGIETREGLVAMASDPGMFAATFTVVLPGSVTASDADRVDGNVASWDLPVDELIDVSASSGPPSPLGSWVVTAIGIGLLVVVVVVGVLMMRRRRRDRRTAPHGRVEHLKRWS